MGTGYHGGFGNTNGSASHSSIDQNIKSVKRKYKLNSLGYFGERGKNVRVIKSSDPVASSADFFEKLGNGGQTSLLPNGKGKMALLDDGTRIVYRVVTSTPNSPAVEITVSNSTLVHNQKIHFIQED